MYDSQVLSASCRHTDEEWDRRTSIYKADWEYSKQSLRQTDRQTKTLLSCSIVIQSLCQKDHKLHESKQTDRQTDRQTDNKAVRLQTLLGRWVIPLGGQLAIDKEADRCHMSSFWLSLHFHWCLAIYLPINSRYTREFMNSACLKDCCFSFYPPPPIRCTLETSTGVP